MYAFLEDYFYCILWARGLSSFSFEAILARSVKTEARAEFNLSPFKNVPAGDISVPPITPNSSFYRKWGDD